MLDMLGSARCVSPGRSTGLQRRRPARQCDRDTDGGGDRFGECIRTLPGSGAGSEHHHDSQDIIDQLREFVEGLADENKRVTAADLPRLQKLWDECESNDPRRVVPGVNQDPEGLIQDFTAGFALNNWSPPPSHPR
ncbi:hypothetical protein [Rhodococcus zopfii]|uniref:hypothetical protein n=1 Tax=Rhodococcus zopfii TaxID=43772 RepID=UPI0011112AB3|nr:hypothetical protein [Rhodococcus zopfii]